MKKLLELVMIVKNSGEILRECLRNNKQWIDEWTIIDTGSVDSTVNIIKEELKDIKGNLYFSEFIDFSSARNKSLELSSKKCKYTIILDDSYKIHGGDKLRKILEKSNESALSLKIGKYNNYSLNNDYYSIRIIKSNEKLKYKYRIHEIIDIDEHKVKKIEDINIFINDLDDYNHFIRTNKRGKNDIKLLLLDYKDNPKNPRTVYFLARMYYITEEYKESLKFYKILKELKDSDDLYYKFTAEYEIININYYLDKDKNKFINELIKLQKKYTIRAEPGYKLVSLYMEENKLINAENLIEKLILVKKPEYINVILDTDIYDYNIPYMYIEIKLLLKKIDNKVITILKELLKKYPNNQELLNIKYNLSYDMNGKNLLDISSIKLSNNKTIVIHIGSIVECFNPKIQDKRISGSEIVAINIAKEFYNLGYRVFIFGSFENKNLNINYECIHENIEYIDLKYFNEFVLKYVVDYLIISRQITNLVYYNNIKNVYLWVHDTLPDFRNAKGLQTHKTKFKKIICVSEWQQNNLKDKLCIPDYLYYKSRNAIYIDRFLNKNIEKIPYRFIYSSDPSRGLSYLIEMIPKIKEKYNQTTLFIFANETCIDNVTLDKIKKLDYVFLYPRLNQESIAIEYLKSDVWLYPTDFKETYCITAVEAMVAKCLVATVNYAALGEIVNNRGILCKNPIEDNMNELLKKLFFVLDNPDLKNNLIEKSFNWAVKQTYNLLAKEWINDIF